MPAFLPSSQWSVHFYCWHFPRFLHFYGCALTHAGLHDEWRRRQCDRWCQREGLRRQRTNPRSVELGSATWAKSIGSATCVVYVLILCWLLCKFAHNFEADTAVHLGMPKQRRGWKYVWSRGVFFLFFWEGSSSLWSVSIHMSTYFWFFLTVFAPDLCNLADSVSKQGVACCSSSTRLKANKSRRAHTHTEYKILLQSIAIYCNLLHDVSHDVLLMFPG